MKNGLHANERVQRPVKLAALGALTRGAILINTRDIVEKYRSAVSRTHVSRPHGHLLMNRFASTALKLNLPTLNYAGLI